MNRRGFIKLAAMAVASVSLWSLPDRWLRPEAAGGGPGCGPAVTRTFRLMAAGDIMMHASVIASGLLPGGGYDFRPCFQYLRPLFQNCDLVSGNLETPLAGAGAGFTGYPDFNAPDELAAALKWAGFSLLNLANNHSLDRGWKGLSRTVEIVDKAGLMYVGAYADAQDRAAPRLCRAGGVTTGLLGYTYGVNGNHKNRKDEPWRLNFIDEKKILADVEELRGHKPDFIIVNLHFGDEYSLVPNKKQLALAAELFDAHADLIIGHHPHVAQPGLLRQGPSGGQAAVFSLGNLLSNQNAPHTDQGLLLDVSLGFDLEGRKIMGPVTLHPTRCLRQLIDNQPVFRATPVLAATANPEAYGLTRKEADRLLADRGALAWRLAHFDPAG